MQVTIDIPERLAARLEPERDRLAAIIESGLRLKDWVGTSPLTEEVVAFLARGPRPAEIVAFRPSEAALARERELLARNKERPLAPSEEAELDEMALLDHLVTLIKAKVGRGTAPELSAQLPPA